MGRAFDVKHDYYKGEIYTTNDPNTNSLELNESAVSYNKQHYTIEEYLEMERASDVKHEYYQGEIFAMAMTSRGKNGLNRTLSTFQLFFRFQLHIGE